ncbi:hypothetical protein AVEN_206621-1 [Araneus ventricosus]|uniref:Uncharacterized protein n=1 Tax=Araneus ventricosus TaxID=182803 RepID=A0A4Y2KLS7_ARAVE|nr:hypothetical protein AVEN_206621-1 [Araneus ventricosus]
MIHLSGWSQNWDGEKCCHAIWLGTVSQCMSKSKGPPTQLQLLTLMMTFHQAYSRTRSQRAPCRLDREMLQQYSFCSDRPIGFPFHRRTNPSLSSSLGASPYG